MRNVVLGGNIENKAPASGSRARARQTPGGRLYFTIWHLLSFPRHRALFPPGCRWSLAWALSPSFITYTEFHNQISDFGPVVVCSVKWMTIVSVQMLISRVPERAGAGCGHVLVHGQRMRVCSGETRSNDIVIVLELEPPRWTLALLRPRLSKQRQIICQQLIQLTTAPSQHQHRPRRWNSPIH